VAVLVLLKLQEPQLKQPNQLPKNPRAGPLSKNVSRRLALLSSHNKRVRKGPKSLHVRQKCAPKHSPGLLQHSL
jgi:hypothetical protein